MSGRAPFPRAARNTQSLDHGATRHDWTLGHVRNAALAHSLDLSL
jgi:hypothetical protein